MIIYQKCPFKGHLSLAGCAQSSVSGELKRIFDFQPRLGSILWFYLVYVMVDVGKLI